MEGTQTRPLTKQEDGQAKAITSLFDCIGRSVERDLRFDGPSDHAVARAHRLNLAKNKLQEAKELILSVIKA